MEKLKIGRRKYNYRIPTDPSYENFTNIIKTITIIFVKYNSYD